MAAFLLWLPWILRGLSLFSGVAGLMQGVRITTDPGFGASPFNLSVIAGWLLTSGGSLLASFLSGPTGWPQIKKALDRVFGWVHEKLKIDPENRTDLDERLMAYIAEQAIILLQKIAEHWTTSPQAKEHLAALRMCQIVDQSGMPPEATIRALQGPSKAPASPAPAAK